MTRLLRAFRLWRDSRHEDLPLSLYGAWYFTVTPKAEELARIALRNSRAEGTPGRDFVAFTAWLAADLAVRKARGLL